MLFFSYITWHYSRGIADFFGVWRNFLWFITHVLSVPTILRTFFAPWKRLQEDQKATILEPSALFSKLLVNMMMRLVGIFLRTLLLLISFAAFVVVLVLGTVLFIAWLVLPVLIILLFIQSFRLIF